MNDHDLSIPLAHSPGSLDRDSRTPEDSRELIPPIAICAKRVASVWRCMLNIHALGDWVIRRNPGSK
jgi:hypothetical protein